jgi:NADP-dependent aldehyde dehydrogenase
MTTSELTETSEDQLELFLAQASSAAGPFGAIEPSRRARMLEAIATSLNDAAELLCGIAAEETHLAPARLHGELARTCFQLELMASALDEGAYLGMVIDNADERWPTGPRPNLRRMLRPLGPVVVFAASNFPFAFGVAGGDTASALASGCPVVLKVHPGHPRLSCEIARLVRDTLDRAGAPVGTFREIYGERAGRLALLHPRIAAGAFTGSLAAGRLLFDLACSRPHPIPFFGELGSINPVFVTRRAAERRRNEIIRGFVSSFTLGAGQFCTKPGVIFLPDADSMLRELGEAVDEIAPAELLNDTIAARYEEQRTLFARHPALHQVSTRSSGARSQPFPHLLRTSMTAFLSHADDLLSECFGPTSLAVSYDDERELLAAAHRLDGQLTTTLHAEEDDAIAEPLLEILAEHAGRVVWNDWPTGVSVTWAMQHGGPYPSTTAPQTTSVGTEAIGRFLRPVTYQSVPDHLLPVSLREQTYRQLPHRLNGHLVRPEGDV